MTRQDIKAGSSYVELLLRDRKFTRGLKAAGGLLKKFAKAGVLAGAALAGVGVKSFLSFGDNLDKMSRRTGVSVQALSELKHAAELSGSSLNTVEKGIRGMQRNLLDAERGLSTATDNLDDLGISLRDLQGMSPEEQFQLIASRIGGIEDPSKRAAVAMKIFGRAGSELLPMFDSGPDGLAKMREEAQRLGLTMDGDTAAAAARLNDLFSTLWSTLKQVAISIGAALAPLLEAVLPSVQSLATGTVMAIRDMSEQAMAWWGQMSGTVIGHANLIWSVVKDVFSGLLDFWSTIWGGVANLVGEVWNFITDSTGLATQSFMGLIIDALSTVSFAWNNWRVLLQTATTSAMLSVVRFANQTVHLFSEVIPAWLSFFFDNWRDIFTDVANLTATVATNIWNNLSNLWEAIVSLFSGEGFSFEWTPLTEGFESAIKEWPKIAEREMGPLEKSLQDDLNKLADDLVMNWEEHGKEFAKRVDQFLPSKTEFEAVTKQQQEGVKQALEATPNRSQSKKEVISSFSLAALAGQVGGTGDDPTAKAVKKAATEQEKRDGRLLRAVREAGTIGP